MRERETILGAWATERAAGRQAVLATVVRIEGSAYRRVGARMLVLQHGGHAGSVSAGCLEHEIIKRAFFWTDAGPVIRPFSTATDDDSRPYGMGCDGVVHVLLERLRPDGPCPQVALLDACRRAGKEGALATVIAAPTGDDMRPGDHLALWPDGRIVGSNGEAAPQSMAGPVADAEGSVIDAIVSALRRCTEEGTRQITLAGPRGPVGLLLERIEPPRRLLIFGAGDDAVPVVRIAKELGWHVTVSDARSHQATAARFPQADRVVTTPKDEPLSCLEVPAGAACVVMSHSFDQDRAVLAALAPLPLAYLGLLGSRGRRDALLRGIEGIRCAGGLHAPVGLDIGSDSPEGIALAIVAEVHACLAGAGGGHLRDRDRATLERSPRLVEAAR